MSCPQCQGWSRCPRCGVQLGLRVHVLGDGCAACVSVLCANGAVMSLLCCAVQKRAVGLGVSDHKLQEKLRIVSGSAAGRKLVSFRSPQTRPMMEKVGAGRLVCVLVEEECGGRGEGIVAATSWPCLVTHGQTAACASRRKLVGWRPGHRGLPRLGLGCRCGTVFMELDGHCQLGQLQKPCPAPGWSHASCCLGGPEWESISCLTAACNTKACACAAIESASGLTLQTTLLKRV